MAKKRIPPSSNRAGKSRHGSRSDPEPATLLLGIIAGIAGLGSFALQLSRHLGEKKLKASQQRSVRKSIQKNLQQLLSDLNEWKELLDTARGFYEAGEASPERVEFRIGGLGLEVTDSELKRFGSTTDRIQRLQKSTTKACAILGSRLPAIESLSMEEARSIEGLRDDLIGVIKTFNDRVFASQAPTDSESRIFRTHAEVLEALTELIGHCGDSLSRVELVLGADYDKPI